MSCVGLKPTSLKDQESPSGTDAGSALPPKMDWAISARSSARLSASRTRLSFDGPTRPSGPRTHHMVRTASSRR